MHHVAGVRLSCDPLRAPLIAKVEPWRRMPPLADAAVHTMRCAALAAPSTVGRTIRVLVEGFGYLRDDALVRAALAGGVGEQIADDHDPARPPRLSKYNGTRSGYTPDRAEAQFCGIWLKTEARRFFGSWHANGSKLA